MYKIIVFYDLKLTKVTKGFSSYCLPLVKNNCLSVHNSMSGILKAYKFLYLCSDLTSNGKKNY